MKDLSGGSVEGIGSRQRSLERPAFLVIPFQYIPLNASDREANSSNPPLSLSSVGLSNLVCLYLSIRDIYIHDPCALSNCALLIS